MNLSKEQLLEIGTKKRNGELPKEQTWQWIADTYGGDTFADGETLRSWVKNQLLRKNKINDDSNKKENETQFKESFEIKKDGSQTSSKLVEISETTNKNPRYLLEAHGFDPDEWKLVNAKGSEWTGYSKQDGQFPMYASKITVEPRKDSLDIETIKKIFKEMSQEYKRPTHRILESNNSGKMLEISIADLHIGKLCWVGDSNDTYNFEIARDRFFYIIKDVLTKTQGYKFEKIIFVWSNDFFHFDNLSNSTTNFTRQDTDLKLPQMFKLGVRMLIEAIDILSSIAPVETFYVGSNHDKLVSYFATEYIDAWYKDDKNVRVDTDPKIRKYVEFGKCLIQFSHGHAEGKRIGDVMSVEEREAWGRCVFNEVHAGHFHSEKTVSKDNGVIVRYLGSPTGTDTWHYESGYVSAIKKGQSFVWDREHGLEQIIYTTITK